MKPAIIHSYNRTTRTGIVAFANKWGRVQAGRGVSNTAGSYRAGRVLPHCRGEASERLAGGQGGV